MQLSLGRFRSEHWWERKAEAYSAIVESLHHLRNYCELELEQYYIPAVNYRPPDQGVIDAINAKMADASEQIDKAADVGSFLISSEAADLLQKLKKQRREARFDASYDPSDYFQAELRAVNDCLKEIRGIAKRDLGVS